jgi:hypothetical protein
MKNPTARPQEAPRAPQIEIPIKDAGLSAEIAYLAQFEGWDRLTEENQKRVAQSVEDARIGNMYGALSSQGDSIGLAWEAEREAQRQAWREERQATELERDKKFLSRVKAERLEWREIRHRRAFFAWASRRQWQGAAESLRSHDPLSRLNAEQLAEVENYVDFLQAKRAGAEPAHLVGALAFYQADGQITDYARAVLTAASQNLTPPHKEYIAKSLELLVLWQEKIDRAGAVEAPAIPKAAYRFKRMFKSQDESENGGGHGMA